MGTRVRARVGRGAIAVQGRYMGDRGDMGSTRVEARVRRALGLEREVVLLVRG